MKEVERTSNIEACSVEVSTLFGKRVSSKDRRIELSREGIYDGVGHGRTKKYPADRNASRWCRCAPMVALLMALLLVVALHPVRANNPTGDLILEEARPFHATWDSDVLVEKKYFKTRLVITSTFPSSLWVDVYKGALSDRENCLAQYDPYSCMRWSMYWEWREMEMLWIHPGENVIFFPKWKRAPFVPVNDYGAICFWYYITPHGWTIDDISTNNEIVTCPPVLDTMKYRTQYIPIDLGGSGSPDCQLMMEFSGKSTSYVVGTYPIAEKSSRQYWSRTSCTPLSFSSPTIAVGELGALSWFAGDSEVSHFDMFVGVAPAGSFMGAGLAFSSSQGFYHGALVQADQLGGATTAHEMAHALGWIPVGHPLNIGNGHMTLPAPGYWVNMRCEMGHFLYSNLPDDPCDPSGAPNDFMSPSAGGQPWDVRHWISGPTWEYLADALTVQTETQKVIGMNLFLNPYGTLQSGPWYRFESTLDIPLDNPGEYRILYLDQDGQKIAETGFVEFGYQPDGDSRVGLFSGKIPDVEGTHKIVIKRGEQVLYERILSPSVPLLEITNPIYGELYKPGGTVTVQWNASDADGDPLTYLVFLSQDIGKTWTPISSHVINTSFSFVIPPNIPPDVLASPLMIKVVASDGVNTAVATNFHEIDIDIKPGSDPNSVNCDSKKGERKAVVPLGIFTDDEFEAKNVDVTTLKLEGVQVTVKKDGLKLSDLDHDGDLDAIIHLERAAVCEATKNLTLKQSKPVILTGQITDGQVFRGVDTIRIVRSGVGDAGAARHSQQDTLPEFKESRASLELSKNRDVYAIRRPFFP